MILISLKHNPKKTLYTKRTFLISWLIKTRRKVITKRTNGINYIILTLFI